MSNDVGARIAFDAQVRRFCLAFSAVDEIGNIQNGNYYMTLTGALTSNAIESAKSDWAKQVSARQSVIVQYSKCVCFGLFQIEA